MSCLKPRLLTEALSRAPVVVVVFAVRFRSRTSVRVCLRQRETRFLTEALSPLQLGILRQIIAGGMDARQLTACISAWTMRPYIADGADERTVLRHRYRLAQQRA